MSTPKLCPHCGSNDIQRSHRRLLERVLLIVRPYRCGDCQRRFYTLQPMRLPSRAY